MEQKTGGILLESGTNEVEIIEFFIREQCFGVNVAKVRQIVPFMAKQLNRQPLRQHGFMGQYLQRGELFPLIDLRDVFRLDDENKSNRPLVLICEFNVLVSAYLIDGVNRIHRISWKSIRPLSMVLASSETFTGTVTLEDREILLVDMEFILAEVMGKHHGDDLDGQLPEVDDVVETELKLTLAEDSLFFRKKLVEDCIKSGIPNVEAYANGEECFNAIKKHVQEAKENGRPITDYINVLLTDIEMPQMDGLTLCRKVRQDLKLEKLPIVIYSSLITEQMAEKCRSVGADAFVSKPHSGKVIEIVDEIKEHIRLAEKEDIPQT